MTNDDLEKYADKLLSQEDFTAAIKIYDQLISKVTNEAKFYARRGFAYFQLRDWGKAIQNFSNAIDLKKEVPSTYFLRARAYEETGNLKEALSDYDLGIKFDPGKIDVYVNKGLIQEYLGKYEEAKKTYLAAYAIDNKNEIVNNCINAINEKIRLQDIDALNKGT